MRNGKKVSKKCTWRQVESIQYRYGVLKLINCCGRFLVILYTGAEIKEVSETPSLETARQVFCNMLGAVL